MLKWIILLALSPLLTACMTLSGNYQLEALDNNGDPIQTGMRITAQGSGIYTSRNAMCSAIPGATIRITDIDTGKELNSESPYQCRGKLQKKRPSAAAGTEPWNFDFDGRTWVIGNQGANKNLALKEYILKGENIKNWSELVTSAYYFLDPSSPRFKYIHQVGGAGYLLLLTYKKQMPKTCKQVKVNIIKSEPGDMLLEWQHQGCDKYPPQHQIQRVIDRPDGSLSLAYVKKTKKLSDRQRQQWIRLLHSATYKHHLSFRTILKP